MVNFREYYFDWRALPPAIITIQRLDTVGNPPHSSLQSADYHDFQLYNLAWFETLDFPNRTTSLDHTQTTPSTDGRLRIVVSHSDPGVPNWIDTMGYNQAMFTYRWIKPRTTPTATARVVPMAELRNHLPDDTPRLTRAS